MSRGFNDYTHLTHPGHPRYTCCGVWVAPEYVQNDDPELATCQQCIGVRRFSYPRPNDVDLPVGWRRRTHD